MPFRAFYAGVPAGQAKCIYTAREDDTHISIRSAPLPGQHQASNGYNFTVGGPELEGDPALGLFCFDSQFETDMDDGDEVWVGIPEESPWTMGDVPLTVLVRTRQKKAG